MTGTQRPSAGLQPERTTLAWQRVALALAGLGLASVRIASPTLGGWGVLPAAAVIAVAVVLFASALPRYRSASLALSDGRASTVDGRLPLVAAATVLLLGALALVVVLGRTG